MQQVNSHVDMRVKDTQRGLRNLDNLIKYFPRMPLDSDGDREALQQLIASVRERLDTLEALIEARTRGGEHG